jgi:hypothetical protein
MMARKRSPEPATTEKQMKRLRLAAGALTRSFETETPPPVQPVKNDCDDQGITMYSSPPVVETKRSQPFLEPVVPVVDKRRFLLLGGEKSRRASTAGGGWKAHQQDDDLLEQRSTTTASTLRCCFDDCSSSSLRYDSEGSCLSLPMLEIRAKECYNDNDYDDDDQRRQEDEPKTVYEYKNRQQRPVRTSGRVSSFTALFGLIVCLCTSFGIDWTAPISAVVDQYRVKADHDSICVSGGGFSGFWFILGRLQSIPDPTNKNYYCFSAGCLGLVASLRGIAMEDVHGMATNLQTQWKTGEIERHEVLTSFVDFLVYHKVSNETSDGEIVGEDLPFLNRLNVLTTVRDGRFGLKTSTRTPTTVDSLRTFLVQSAWIPFVVGDELFHRNHMDGAFYLFGHPSCQHSIGLQSNFDMLANVLNVNLSADKVRKFWKMGIERGL